MGKRITKQGNDEMKIIRQFIETLSGLACELRGFRMELHNQYEWFRSHSGLATKQDLKEMEKRLAEAITSGAVISPSTEEKAKRLQSALDKLDATIPDKKGS